MSDLQDALDQLDSDGPVKVVWDDVMNPVVEAARKYANLTDACPTCEGRGHVVPSRTLDGCHNCSGRGRVISDHVIEAAARKMYAEVGTRKDNTLTYDIAYPDEQADFLRVAEKMLWAGVEARDTESAR